MRPNQRMPKPEMPNPHSDHEALHERRMIVLGVITSAHGIKGEVKIKPFTENPDSIANYGKVSIEGERCFKIVITGRHKDLLICRLDDITNRDQAEILKGEMIYVPHDRLPRDDEAWYHAQILGITVENADGVAVGVATGFFDFGGGALIEVAREDGEKILLPFTAERRILIDLHNKICRLTIDPVWLESPGKQDD